MRLVLGTAQFGLAYGVAGRGQPVAETEIRQILALARQGGIETLDTAAAYGDIESRLRAICAHLRFDVVSKFPAVPPELSPVQSAAWVLERAEQSRLRLDGSLRTLLAHDSADFSGDRGRAIADSLTGWAGKHGVAFGASTYGPEPCRQLLAERGIRHFQLPANALDQRIAAEFPEPGHGLELHVRSIFLQGLLLMPEAAAAARVPAAASALSDWHGWCRRHGYTPLQAALAIAKGLEGAQAAVVGVDSARQLEEILSAWNDAPALRVPELSCEDVRVIDPRRWFVAPSNQERT